mmetsp:Transcript_32979/g.37428  ORF Transcript_32979/g.37428 Transcript_32979/m.37428 type:complete len:223 (+) Transcript_32979:114-782(+)
MEQKSDLAGDMIASDAAFHDQFDRDSTDFHHGDPTPVATGGQRIPESMPSVYTEEKKVEVSNYGPDYDRLMNLRAKLGDFKKTASKVGPSIEGVMRLNEKMNAADTKEAQKTKLEAQVKAEEAKLANTVSDLNAYKSLFEAGTEFDAPYLGAIDEITTGAHTKYADKDQYGDFVFLIRRHTQRVFKDQKNLLEQIKKIKREKEAESSAQAARSDSTEEEKAK